MDMNQIELKENLCLSGGADGADIAFGKAALSAGHGLIHWSFVGHKPKQQKNYVIQLSQDQLTVADEYLIKANDFVKRNFPSNNDYVNNLLRRNYYQVKDSESVYAISEINGLMVSGGTFWAVALFLLLRNYEPSPCFVYCQKSEKWHEWNGTNWVFIVVPPKPRNIYAGIGSRNISFIGEQAVYNLYK